MPVVKSSLVHPVYKTEYRVRNWREYEQGLRSWGDVTIWFSEEATASWSAWRTTTLLGSCGTRLPRRFDASIVSSTTF